MSTDSQDILTRFHRALVREIRTANPEHLSAPFTVAEIYQNLVPYRTHRDELEVEMNGDYEHALLRLLAGEGEYLTIESRTARQEIREELDSPNPNTGLYRDFAAADVRLNPDKLDEALGSVEAAGEDEGGFVPQQGFGADELRALDEAEVVEDVEEDEEVDAGEDEVDVGIAELIEMVGLEDEEGMEALGEDEAADELASQELPLEVTEQESPPLPGLEDDGEEENGGELLALGDDLPEEDEQEEALEAQGEGEGAVPALETCPWCRESLPGRSGVSFCPYCGSNVKVVPCPTCGEELELNWRFCVACGTEVPS